MNTVAPGFCSPSTRYLSYVSLQVLRREESEPVVDPFSPTLPAHKLELAYVQREAVDLEIDRQGSQIIIGHPGCGKTTLLEHLTALGNNPKSRTLMVGLPLSEIVVSVPEKDLLTGEVSGFSPRLLGERIFQSFWEQIPGKQKLLPVFPRPPIENYFQGMRRNKEWMLALQWFYQYYQPPYRIIPEDFELEAWLAAKHTPYYPLQLQGEEALRKLIHFITAPMSWDELRYGPKSPWPYDRVQIYIDGAERLSRKALDRLLKDAEKLQDMGSGYVDFKLFLEPTYQQQALDLDCIQRGSVTLYTIPSWENNNLKRLLSARIKAWAPKDDPATGDPDWDWTERLYETQGLLGRGGILLADMLAQGAIKAREKQTSFDAPIHALRLARNIVSACAGCYPDFQPPLSGEQCRAIVDAYVSGTSGGDNHAPVS